MALPLSSGENSNGGFGEITSGGYSYDGLCAHYRMTPSRNNKGVAHENGSIESAQAVGLDDPFDSGQVRADARRTYAEMLELLMIACGREAE